MTEALELLRLLATLSPHIASLLRLATEGDIETLERLKDIVPKELPTEKLERELREG